eukprot:292942-Chlamydomonas_euryale.AAC.2
MPYNVAWLRLTVALACRGAQHSPPCTLPVHSFTCDAVVFSICARVRTRCPSNSACADGQHPPTPPHPTHMRCRRT